MKNRDFGFNLSTQPYIGPVGYKVDWENKFGGGALDITAETIIKGIPVRDTYIGKMEGERTTDEFRTKMIDYLKLKGEDLKTDLDNADVLFALACVESGVNHFYPPPLSGD